MSAGAQKTGITAGVIGGYDPPDTVPGAELGSSGRAVRTLHCCAISPFAGVYVLLLRSVLFVFFSVLYARSCYATLAGLDLAM